MLIKKDEFMKKYDLNYFVRGINYLKKNLLFFNVSNSNIRDLAYKNYCYKKLFKKYKKTIIDFKNNGKKEFSDYIWVCWFQGLENAPDLVKSCIKSVENNFPNKKVIIITYENMYDYVSFPDYIIKKRNRGLISNAHFSDLLRLRLLNQYGGMWIDSTVFVSGKVDEKFWKNELFCFKELSLFPKEELPIRASNWLIYSTSNNDILVLTEKLLYDYYKRELYVKNYYIFHLFFSMASKKFQDQWDKVPSFSNINNHILQFELEKKYSYERWSDILKITSFHKLNRRVNIEDKESNYYHIIKEFRSE
jgi:hypothetical protein